MNELDRAARLAKLIASKERQGGQHTAEWVDQLRKIQVDERLRRKGYETGVDAVESLRDQSVPSLDGFLEGVTDAVNASKLVQKDAAIRKLNASE